MFSKFVLHYAVYIVSFYFNHPCFILFTLVPRLIHFFLIPSCFLYRWCLFSKCLLSVSFVLYILPSWFLWFRLFPSILFRFVCFLSMLSILQHSPSANVWIMCLWVSFNFGLNVFRFCWHSLYNFRVNVDVLLSD